MDKMAKLVGRSGSDKAMKEEYDTLCKIRDLLEDGKHVRFSHWTEKEVRDRVTV